MSEIAKTPQPPYYAAIFVTQRSEIDNGYSIMAGRMAEMASNQTGFLGMESASEEGMGITVSYWDSLEAIKEWRNHSAHQAAQERGIAERYKSFGLRICKVERDNFS